MQTFERTNFEESSFQCDISIKRNNSTVWKIVDVPEDVNENDYNLQKFGIESVDRIFPRDCIFLKVKMLDKILSPFYIRSLNKEFVYVLVLLRYIFTFYV